MKSTVVDSQSVEYASKHRVQGKISPPFKLNDSDTYRSRKTHRSSTTTSKHQQQYIQQVADTILQRRDRLRVFHEGENLTPRNLVSPLYACVEDKRTAFDVISIAMDSSRVGSSAQLPSRTSILTPSGSFSSGYTLDEIMAARRYDSLVESFKGSYKSSPSKGLDVIEDTKNVPLQFHLPGPVLEGFKSPNEKVTIVLSETETIFLFELQHETEDANSPEGHAVVEENERYERVLAMSERKTMSVETQTPQMYTKTQGTCIPKHERKNRGTIVNNWVMYDTFQNKSPTTTAKPIHEFKFRESKLEEVHRDPEDQLAIIGTKPSYEEATRIALRFLSTKIYEEKQKRFVGILRQDPNDPNLQLVYGLEFLWCHTSEELERRRVSAVSWNPANGAILAAGYTSPAKSRQNKKESSAAGLVIVWCAKNPTVPGRRYEFSSSVSDVDWSVTRPNLLAVGFYDGIVKIIDVSKVQLTIVRQSSRDTVPSYEPHWQVLWWPIAGNTFENEDEGEQLYSCNQDGRIYSFSSDVHFRGHEILRIWRTEGKVPGIPQYDVCPSYEVPVVRSAALLLLRPYPSQPGIYFVATEQGYVHRCSTSHHEGHLDTFHAHNGPVYDLEFSPFCESFMLTCGADWTSRVWVEGVNEPLLTFGVAMACVASACWSPRNSTIFATAVNNEICIWDIRRKTYRPVSVTLLPQASVIQQIKFTRNGEQIVAVDDDGKVYVYETVGMPFPPLDQKQTLINAVEKALLIKPELLRRFRKLDLPFEGSTND